MKRHISAPAARWAGAAAGIAGGALLYRYEDPTDHGPWFLALVAGLMVVALVATWLTLETRPGWVGVGGFALSAAALGIAFAIVGGFMFALAVAFRHVRTPWSAALWIAGAVLFLTTPAWSEGFGVAWILWGLALVAEGTVDLLAGAHIRRRLSRERA